MSTFPSFQWAQENLKIVVASGTAMIASVVAVWKFGSKVFDIVTGVFVVLKLAATLDRRLTSIEKELMPNGGMSLRDSVDWIRRSQTVQDRTHEALLDALDVPWFKSDPTGKCEWINRAYLRLTGKAIDEVRGNGWLSCMHPDDREAVFNEWTAAVKQNRNFEMAYRVLDRDGSVVKVHGQAKVLRDHKGDIIGFIGSLIREP